MSQKRILIALVCIAGYLPAMAQDSVQVLSSEFQRHFDFYSKEAITQAVLQNTRYNIVQAGYGRTNGQYMMAQDAPRSNHFFFTTKGIRQLKKFLVSGSFGYRRSLPDSVGYSLRPGPEKAAPYYFYAGKKGNWEMSRYHLEGVATNQVNRSLNIGAGVHYEAGNAWRSNDPRPEFFEHAMNGFVALRYAVTPKHTLGIQGHLIKENTETAIEYRNMDYRYNLRDYPEYATYMQSGYTSEEPYTSANIRNNTSGWGWQALYEGQTSFGTITLKGGYKATDSKFFRNGSLTENEYVYGWFYEDVWDGSLYWQYKTGNNWLSLQGNYYNNIGRDLNTKYNGNNYVYALEYAQLKPLYTHVKNGRPHYELGIDAGVSDLFRADGNSGIVADYQNAHAGVLGAYYWWLPSWANCIKAELAAGWRGNISYELRYSSQQSVFTRDVILRDAVYQTATVFNGSAALTGQFTVKKLRTFIYTKGHYQQATLRPGTIPVTSLPGKERFIWEAGIGVIL